MGYGAITKIIPAHKPWTGNKHTFYGFADLSLKILYAPILGRWLKTVTHKAPAVFE
jgi:hypothetical protein